LPKSRTYRMPFQIRPDRYRRCLIEKNPHLMGRGPVLCQDCGRQTQSPL
jgi:hypothetical protein